ncbi:MAG: methyltransferase domain-containing protein [Burkholderiaceae bacterium]|nr:methyltransferase domain-containing protein [Burkholderiaceae bacterium]
MPDSPILLEQFGAFVEDAIGLSFSPARWNDLWRAVAEMTRQQYFHSMDDCMRSMMNSSAEHTTAQTLGRYLANGETYFFRDACMFSALRLEIIPRLIARRRASGASVLHMLSAGCCSGEEAYSLAMLVQDLSNMPDMHDMGEWELRVVGVDINPAFLQAAQKGNYGAWSFRGVPEALKLRHFEPLGEGRFAVLSGIKPRVDFRYLNLAADDFGVVADMAPFDLVLCQNVLMYFGAKSWRHTVARMHGLLAEGGWLCVGPIESDRAFYPQYRPVEFDGVTFFQKVEGCGKP